MEDVVIFLRISPFFEFSVSNFPFSIFILFGSDSKGMQFESLSYYSLLDDSCANSAPIGTDNVFTIENSSSEDSSETIDGFTLVDHKKRSKNKSKSQSNIFPDPPLIRYFGNELTYVPKVRNSGDNLIR